MEFYHGVRFAEVDGGGRPISVPRSSIVGLAIIPDFGETAPECSSVIKPGIYLFTNSSAVNEQFDIENAEISNDAKQVLSEQILEPLNAIYKQTETTVILNIINPAPETGTVLGSPSSKTGLWAFLNAQPTYDVVPKILAIVDHRKNATEDINTELVSLAEYLKAVAIIEPLFQYDANSVYQEYSLQDFVSYRDNFGSERAYFVANHAVKDTGDERGKIPVAISPYVAGVLSKTDIQEGFWVSPSNHDILGISEVWYKHDYLVGNPSSDCNYLNENDITAIRKSDGFRIWGNHSLASDPKWKFLCVRRTFDVVSDALLYSMQWAVDKGINVNFAEWILIRINEFLRNLQAQGAILGGYAYLDPELNNPNELQQGRIYFDFKITPVYPAEDIIFRGDITDLYLKTMVDTIAQSFKEIEE